MADEEGKRILIVEDEAMLAELLCRALRLRLGSGYQIEYCLLAEEAMARLQHQQIDLIVTDLSMPDGSGLELIRHVRQVSPQTRAVLITAYLTPEVEDQARELSATYLFKPFEMKEFIATVRRALDEGTDA